MSRFLQYIVILFSSIIFIASCGGGGGGGGGETGSDSPTADELRASVVQFNGISDARGFVFTGDNPTSGKIAARSANLRTAALDVNLDPNSLYKVSADGTLSRVEITDDSNTEILRGLIQPVDVRDIDQNFMIMYFIIREAVGPITGDESVSASLSAYLVNKTNGLAYLMDSLGAAAGTVECQQDSSTVSVLTPGSTGFVTGRLENGECRLSNILSTSDISSRPRFTTDDQSNIYLRADPTADDGNGETYVFKIDTQNLGGTTISATQLHTAFPLVGNKWGWEVDPGGEYVVLGSGTNTYYLDIATGTFINLEQELAKTNPGYTQIDNENIYKDLEGKIYVWGRQATGPSRLFRIDSVAAGNSEFFDINSANTPTSSTLSVRLQEDMERMVVNGRLLYVDYFRSGFDRNLSGFFIELDPELGVVGHEEPRNQFVNGAWEFATLSNGYFYYFGTYVGFPVDTVYRYNPSTMTGILFEPTSNSPLAVQNLDVSEVRVISDDEVWFRAIDLDDSSTVFGTADIEAGTINITGTTAAAEPVIFIMEAILPSDFIAIDGRYNDWAIDLRGPPDATDDGSAGHELTFVSHQQSSTGFFALVEFLDDNIKSSDAATIVKVDQSHEIVVRSDAAFIVTLADDSQAAFGDVGGISAIGQAVELSVPLNALTGVGITPVVTVRSVSLNDITLSASFNSPNHTVVVTLPRALEGGETVNIQLTGNFELAVSSSTATLVDTSGSTNPSVAGVTGLGSDSIGVTIADADIGAPGAAISPTTTDQLKIIEDQM